MYKIEKGIGKAPGGRFKTGMEIWKTQYPLDKLEIGDSFAVLDHEYSKKNVSKIRARLNYLIKEYKANHPIKKKVFSVGMDPVTRDTKKLIRVWRTK